MANKIRQGATDIPLSKAVAVTPDDNNDLATNTRAIWVGGTGSINVIMEGDTAAVTFAAVPVGLLPIAVKRIRATGTTASPLLALY